MMILSAQLIKAINDPKIAETVQTVQDEYDGLPEKIDYLVWTYKNHELTAYKRSGDIVLTVINLEPLFDGEDSHSLELFSINNNLYFEQEYHSVIDSYS
ncbi:MAG: hypothetical protein IGQ45_15825 [Cyanobacterium sp. T60_A2020_053]|nr:hypothetical protein [Cyanobacterium sp. T60_A2020_053]